MMDEAERARQVRATRDEVEHKLRTVGARVALETLVEISGDRTAPKSARVAASRTLTELNGLVLRQGDGLIKPLHEMTRAELAAARDRAVAYLAELDAPVIEGEESEGLGELPTFDPPNRPAPGGLFE
ncbi:hypothetical protein [Methylobacterium sp. NEAU K]|uniref:hypothetical protein n=1 Tax=Methylobacterium sp. NEAU K TaxID=3064946 RepID=UPI0027371064|nr:hypothetical protein [Methylobacterium sp. NEAU K]MDP4005778.1 hypothetical protein [Methylobacterium sp. NEAU K]